MNNVAHIKATPWRAADAVNKINLGNHGVKHLESRKNVNILASAWAHPRRVGVGQCQRSGRAYRHQRPEVM
jgi:hypothetical protein